MFEKMLDNKANGKCPFCGKTVNEHDFHDELSKKEFKISGLCAECQEEVFGYD